MVRDSQVFERALRSAAAVTGVIKRGAFVGVAVGALSLADGCSSPKPTVQGPVLGTPLTTSNAMTPTAGPPDAGTKQQDCEADPGYQSKCCAAQRALHKSPVACTPWGPPAPPAYRGETIARSRLGLDKPHARTFLPEPDRMDDGSCC